MATPVFFKQLVLPIGVDSSIHVSGLVPGKSYLARVMWTPSAPVAISAFWEQHHDWNTERKLLDLETARLCALSPSNTLIVRIKYNGVSRFAADWKERPVLVTVMVDPLFLDLVPPVILRLILLLIAVISIVVLWLAPKMTEWVFRSVKDRQD